MSPSDPRPLRLAVVEPNPSFGGGLEAVALALSGALAERGHSLVLLHDAEGSMLGRYAEFCAEVVRVPLPGVSLRAPVRTLSAARRILKVLAEQRVEAILTSSVGWIEMAAFVRALGGVSSCFHLGLGCPRRSLRMKLAIRRIGFGVAPSEHTAATWRRAGWRASRLSVVPNWVDHARFRPHPDRVKLRAELGIPAAAKCIVFLGRFCPEKGVFDLIQAFQRLHVSSPGALLAFVGEPPPVFRAEFERQIECLDPGSRKQILRFPVTQHPERYLAAADVVCAPSTWEEPFGLVVLEAMACGVPVVTTTVGVLPELLGLSGAGLLVSPGDPAELAQRLTWWLERPEQAAEVGRQLRRRAVEKYADTAAVPAYESILRALAAGKPTT